MEGLRGALLMVNRQRGDTAARLEEVLDVNAALRHENTQLVAEKKTAADVIDEHLVRVVVVRTVDI